MQHQRSSSYSVPEVLIPQHLHPNTQRKYREVLRKFHVTTSTCWDDVRDDVLCVSNINTRRTCIMVLRQVLGVEGAPAVPRSVRRSYSLPSEQEIVERSAGKYQHLVLVMAFAGLRLSEAVALQHEDLHTNGSQHWLIVSRSRDNDGRINPAKTSGRVVIPAWLFERLQCAPACDVRPGSVYKWMKRRGLQPHGLRHWYATYLVRTTKNVELARRQLRHANLQTTLDIYVEVAAEDELGLISQIEDPFTLQSHEQRA